ncbi:MAG: glycoside hydrolase family 3 C-terminal domain-containing protein [Lachnospiraceae bacterium]|nr:glycoside hydrolase family 3 C-terminal domain-containing protein [Lachnospiraceae bacterium]
MDRKSIAEKIVEESIVLLKNEEQLLPFHEGTEIAVFGRAQIGTLCSGNGSGGTNGARCGTILEECEKSGIVFEPQLKAFYQHRTSAETVSEKDAFDWTKISEMVNSGVMYEIFGKYHPPLEEYDVPESLICQASEKTDTALFVIGRNSGGEECDRHLSEDFDLMQSEKKLLAEVCSHFSRVAIVLNVNGLIDFSWLRQYDSIKSLLFIGIPGEEGAAALAKVLTGRVNPSGKMAVTIAEKYWDYPSAEHFSWNKECLEQILDYEAYGLSAKANRSCGFEKSPVTVYWEDIYAGYRYFDTFDQPVLYPFGHGLSYTSFEICVASVKKTENGISVKTKVKNTGDRAGKEVVQVYVSWTDFGAEKSKGSPEHPYQELKGFEKTSLLAPGQGEEVTVFLPWKELSVYDEERAAWVIDEGNYTLRVGNSSRNTSAVSALRVEETILLEQCANRLSVAECNKEKLHFLTLKDRNVLSSAKDRGESLTAAANTGDGELLALYIRKEDVFVRREGEETEKKGSEISDDVENIKEGEGTENRRERGKAKKREEGRDAESWVETERLKMSAILSELSVEELASLCVGYGPGTPFAALGDRRDPSAIFDKTGKPLTSNSHPTGYPGYVSPAIEEKGIYSVFYKDGPAGTGQIAWPTEMLVACAFDRSLWRLFGDAVGAECEEQQVDIWLAPAVNLHRNPLCGRNFEYFSEDPFLTGVCACEIAGGVQKEHQVLVCPKHFAVNEQETFRRGNGKKKYDAVDSILTERAARELYLKPFEMLVRDAQIACIMTSFNKINGIFAGGNRDLCTHILREEWEFEGVVVTDWGDMDIVADGADAVAAGNDIVMPGGPPVIRQILAGYEDGRITRKDMERAVSHLMSMLNRVEQS